MHKKYFKQKLKLFQRIIFILNVILLFFNLFAYNIRKPNYSNEGLFNFSDDFIINLNIKAYKDISKYLTNKYNTIKGSNYFIPYIFYENKYEILL